MHDDKNGARKVYGTAVARSSDEKERVQKDKETIQEIVGKPVEFWNLLWIEVTTFTVNGNC